MKAETYEKAKRIVDAFNNINENKKSIETKIGLGEDLSTGCHVYISKDNLGWFVGVCKERCVDLVEQLDEL